MLALDWPAVIAHEVGLTRRLLDAVQTVRGAHVLGPLDLDNRRGVVSFAIDGVDSGELCRLADERGVAMRSGFHCAQPLHRALGFPGTARASVAPYNDLADIDAFCAGLENAMRRGGMRPVAAAQNGESAGCRAAVSRHDRREWENFPHGADVGVRGIGPTPAAAFEQAALALTAAVTEPDRVKPTTAVEIRCLAPDLEYLFVEWLNALVYEMDTRQMLFSRFSVHVDGEHLRAEAWGEPVDVVRHRPAAEVKGATMTALQVAQDADGRWHAQCVVDV
jgi:SHS2 domain-containing protein